MPNAGRPVLDFRPIPKFHSGRRLRRRCALVAAGLPTEKCAESMQENASPVKFANGSRLAFGISVITHREVGATPSLLDTGFLVADNAPTPWRSLYQLRLMIRQPGRVAACETPGTRDATRLRVAHA